MKKFLTSVALVALAVAGVSSIAHAQSMAPAPTPPTAAAPGAPGFDPGHPRVNEVNGRLQNQDSRVQQGAQSGALTGGQAARDERHDASIQNAEARDEAAHGGHLTAKEDAHLNERLNNNSNRIKDQEARDAAGKTATPQ